jgi:outer membrane protein OmpA-like peptidoglycan-associated protein
MFIPLLMFFLVAHTNYGGSALKFVAPPPRAIADEFSDCTRTGPPALVLFERNGAALSKEARARLDPLVTVTQETTEVGLSLLIEGHADRVGPEDVNTRLSERRAEAVRNYLITRGAAPDAMRMQFSGENRAPISTDDEVSEPENRSVVIAIIRCPVPR